MDNKLYEVCLKKYNKEIQDSWQEIALKNNYENGERLRSAFRKEYAKQTEYRFSGVSDNPNESKPRILVADIEMLPMKGYFWQLFDQNISPVQVIEDNSLLSWAGRFLDEPEMYCDILTPEEAIGRDDRRIVLSMWQLLSKADIVIGHNWLNFDGKILNTLFLLYNLPALNYKIIDTLVIAKNNFRFSSNKLSFINQKLGIRNKIENDGFPLWRACDEGDEKSLNTMMEYNIGDIYATMDLFTQRLRPYAKGINYSLYNDETDEQCPNCGGKHLEFERYYLTTSGKYEMVRCVDCGTLSRKKKNLLTKAKRDNLLMKL